MGLFGALSTSVAGLRAQSYALENISGNIANSQTTAFKRIDTSFLDLIPDAGVNTQLAGSVTTQSRETNTVQGDVQTAAVSTYMAINGDGFFVVQQPSGSADGQPVFAGVDSYTRRGDFTLDKNGYLVNGAGYYLEGIPIDSTTGNISGTTPQVLKFGGNFLPAQQTTTVTYHANLAKTPLTTKYDSTVPGSELLNTGDFTYNPTVGSLPPTYSNGSLTSGVASNQSSPAVVTSGATLLSGTAPANALTDGFAAGDTITVGSQTLTFMASGATGPNQINVTDDVSTLLSKIDALNGNTTTPSYVDATGQIVLNTGTTTGLNLSFTTADPNVATGLGLASSTVSVPSVMSGTGVVIGSDDQAFINESISGQSVTAYDVSGAPVALQFRWAKTDSASLGTGHSDTWNLFYQTDPTATGTDVAWQNVGVNFTFGANGQMDPAVPSVTLTNAAVSGVSLGDVVVNFGVSGLTSFNDPNGNVSVNDIHQDGFPAGSLQSVSIGDNGRVVGNYSNGRNVDLAQIVLATFNGANFLKRTDGGAFQATDESGPALLGNGGTISGSSLEGSNSDIADEFTKLIVTQQAYSANTKVITTANQMAQDLLNVMR